MNNMEQKNIAPFSMKDKVGYMFGDVGTTFIMGIVSAFTAMYYTNVLGISTGVAGGDYFSSNNFWCIYRRNGRTTSRYT